jgi:hypothetical protein
MQDAYEKITEGSHKYFATADLIIAEKTWYKRLLETVQFYVDQARRGFPDNIIVAAKSALLWNMVEQQKKLDQLHSIIKTYEEESRFMFYLPNKIIEEENLKNAAIGVWGCDLKNEQDLWDLSAGLKELATTDIHFFTFIFVDDERKVTNALRFNEHYFEMFKKILDTGEYDENDSSLPLPVFPDQSMLNVLEGISLRTASTNAQFEAYFKMLVTVWKLLEYRKRLDPSVSVEKKWLEELEVENKSNIRESYCFVFGEQRQNFKPDEATIELFINNELQIGTDESVRFLVEASLVGSASEY